MSSNGTDAPGAGPPLGPLPRVSRPAMLGTMWALCGLAGSLVVARLVIRRHYTHRFYLDDYLTVLALVFLIGNSALMTVVSPTLYELLLVSVGRLIPTPDFPDKVVFFNNCQFSYTFLFWTGLWTVKCAFLAFFYRLIEQLVWPRRAWFAIVAIVILSYIGCVVSYLFACASGNGGVQCRGSEEGTKLTLISLQYSTAVDIITDLLIMSLPIALTIGLNMSWPQKLGLIGVLCLGGVVAIFAIIRAVFNGSDQRTPELSWLTLWTSVESSVAVMAVCLASFKVLLSKPKTTARSTPYLDLSDGTSRRQFDIRATSKSKSMHSRRINETVDDPGAIDLDELDDDRREHITVTKTFAVSDGFGVHARSNKKEKPREHDAGSQEAILR